MDVHQDSGNHEQRVFGFCSTKRTEKAVHGHTHTDARDAEARMQRRKLQLILAQLLNMHGTVLHNLRLHLNTGPQHGCDVETPP